MGSVRPLRVVHYPGEPEDLGVVVSHLVGGRRYHEVWWHDGHGDEVVPRTGALPGHERRQVVTVPTTSAELRRAVEWCRAAAKSEQPVCLCCWDARDRVEVAGA